MAGQWYERKHKMDMMLALYKNYHQNINLLWSWRTQTCEQLLINDYRNMLLQTPRCQNIVINLVLQVFRMLTQLTQTFHKPSDFQLTY